ncbi:MAG: LysR family transcriptional regulator [Bacteroidales bacterium]|jgi:molybdate transport system regulatory protein
MAGPEGSKYYNIFLGYEVWLTNQETGGRLDDKLVRLLVGIRDKGSLRSAADSLGLSYRKAWGDIRKAEQFIGFPLVEKVRGGKDGGLSRLTGDGSELVEAFSHLHKEFDKAIYRTTKKFFHELNKLP